jgi:hypothetical protein
MSQKTMALNAMHLSRAGRLLVRIAKDAESLEPIVGKEYAKHVAVAASLDELCDLADSISGTDPSSVRLSVIPLDEMLSRIVGVATKLVSDAEPMLRGLTPAISKAATQIDKLSNKVKAAK